jgi:hypothetical protein
VTDEFFHQPSLARARLASETHHFHGCGLSVYHATASQCCWI